jgi:hypothetical protein
VRQLLEHQRARLRQLLGRVPSTPQLPREGGALATNTPPPPPTAVVADSQEDKLLVVRLAQKLAG